MLCLTFLLCLQFLSTLSLRRATDVIAVMTDAQSISIHALLAESDHPKTSSHPHNRDFYPRSPCGERLVKFSVSGSVISISIHALLAESDIFALWMARSHPLFLSTLSLRRATNGFAGVLFLIDISIHALLAESDWISVSILFTIPISIHALLAESDLPINVMAVSAVQISIHALLAESDRMFASLFCGVFLFLSTLSLRRATISHFIPSKGTFHFYPRSPCGERLFFQASIWDT